MNLTAQVREIIQRLELQPADVLAIDLRPREAIVLVARRNADGKKYLEFGEVAADTVRFPIETRRVHAAARKPLQKRGFLGEAGAG